ncbi:MAG: hypothetical protein LW870_12040 [Pirellula sp.]|jgi:hypothetical protein|nr:hypothetical protein [Pirellula sp.]
MVRFLASVGLEFDDIAIRSIRHDRSNPSPTKRAIDVSINGKFLQSIFDENKVFEGDETFIPGAADVN